MWCYFFEDGFSLPKPDILGKLPTVAYNSLNAVVSGHYLCRDTRPTANKLLFTIYNRQAFKEIYYDF